MYRFTPPLLEHLVMIENAFRVILQNFDGDAQIVCNSLGYIALLFRGQLHRALGDGGPGFRALPSGHS